MKTEPFLCPECDSTQASIKMYISTRFDPMAPHSGILQWITCARCGASIPAHLAEQWNGMSPEDAKAEWKREYRERE